jgi:signal transduction histidine kinase
MLISNYRACVAIINLDNIDVKTVKSRSKLTKLKNSKLFNLFILLSGLLLSLWICKLIYEKQELKVISELDNELQSFERKFDEELISSGEVLYSISNLFNAVETITPEVFNDFTRKLIRRKNSILIAEWQPVVKASERESFIRKARGMGLKDFNLWELNKNGMLIKAKTRDLHVPVLFAVSTNSTAKTVGLDLSFSPERMNSKWESLETDKPRASETFRVIMDATQLLSPTGFAITIPVFYKGTDPRSLIERKKNIYGFVAAVFDVEQLLSGATSELNKKDISFKIVDLKNNEVVLKKKPGKSSLVSRSAKMEVHGREWYIVVYAGEKFLNRFTDMSEYIFPFIFALLFCILYLFLEVNRKKSIDLIETQEKLKKAVIEAEASAHSKAMFLANMSHELRTPLSSILGYGELMKRETDTLKRSKYLDIILRSGKHLAEVINDILDVSKLEESKFKLNPVAFKLDSLINQLNELVVSQFNNSNVQYIQKIDPNIDETLFGDEFRIKRILINLLSNAFKFTDHGHVLLTIEKSILDVNRFNLIIQVSDTGKGMSLEFQKNVFDPFTQEDSSYSRGHGGTGLGLSIVSRLVKLMGGTISLTSEVNKGSTFVITLPFENI